MNADALDATRIGLHLDGMRDRVFALGTEQSWSLGEFLCRQGERQRVLHVILEGEVAYPSGWFGPGAHTGELGFLLDVPRTADVAARTPVVSWSVDADAMQRDPAAAAILVAALVRELPSRLRKFRAAGSLPEDFCNATHPSIRALAGVLTRQSHAATAEAIWSFVRELPYRFGPWWISASETLRLGHGMCTTKSNLEVALFRAAGLEAGFVELQGDSSLVLPLLPSAWRPRVQQTVRHYMGAVRLSGRWHVAECSFTDPCLLELAKRWPALNGVIPCRFGEDVPFHPMAHIYGNDPFDVDVYPELSAAMARRSSFDLDQMELLNIVNDTLQPWIFDEPAWLLRARALLDKRPHEALKVAIAAAVVLAGELHGHLQEPV